MSFVYGLLLSTALELTLYHTRMQNIPMKEHVCRALEAVQKFIDKHRRRRKAAEEKSQARSQAQTVTRQETLPSTSSLTIEDFDDINIPFPEPDEFLELEPEGEVLGDDDDEYIFEDDNDFFDRAPTPGPISFIMHAPEDIEDID